MGIALFAPFLGVWPGVFLLAPTMMFAWYVIYVPTWAAERKFASEISMGATKTEARLRARSVHDHYLLWRRNPHGDTDPPMKQ